MLRLSFISIFILLYTSPASAQNYKFAFDTLGKCNNASGDNLFVKATSWAVIYGDADITTIQYEDKEAGRLIVKQKMSVNGIRDILGFRFGTDHVYYFMIIDTKDDKYKMTLSNFQHIAGDYKVGFRLTVLWRFGRHAPSYGSLNQQTIHRRIDRKRWRKIRAKATQHAEETLLQFDAAMKKEEDGL